MELYSKEDLVVPMPLDALRCSLSQILPSIKMHIICLNIVEVQSIGHKYTFTKEVFLNF